MPLPRHARRGMARAIRLEKRRRHRLFRRALRLAAGLATSGMAAVMAACGIMAASPAPVPLQRPALGSIIGYLKDGRPIRMIAGGSGPALVQSKYGDTTSSLTTLDITLSSDTTAGNCLIVAIKTSATTTSPTVSGIKLGGSAGNFAQSATEGNVSTDEYSDWIWADPDCAGDETAVVITCTGGSGSGVIAAWVMEWSGLVTSSVTDRSQGGVDDTATGTFSSGATATTQQASEVAVGMVGCSTTTTPSVSGWTNLTYEEGLLVSYQVLTSEQTVTYSGSFSADSVYTALVVTFYAAASGPASPYYPPGRPAQQRPAALPQPGFARSGKGAPWTAPPVTPSPYWQRKTPLRITSYQQPGYARHPASGAPWTYVPPTPSPFWQRKTALSQVTYLRPGRAHGAPGTPVTPVPGPVNSWSGSYTGPPGFVAGPAPATRTLQIPVTNTGEPGTWLVAFCGWVQPYGVQSTVTVGDDAGITGGNVWEPAGTPIGTSAAAGTTRTSIWVCPNPRQASNVYISPNGYIQSLAVLVVEVDNLSPWLTLAGCLNGYANTGISLPALTLPAPGGQCLLLTACTGDYNPATITGPGTGWTALPQVSASDGSDDYQDITLTPAMRIVPAGQLAAPAACTWELDSDEPAWAAVIAAYDAATGQDIQRGPGASSQDTTAGPLTWAVSPAAGSKVLVALWSSSGETISSVKDNGSTPSTFTRDIVRSANGVQVAIYRADSITLPGSGSYQVTVTASGGHTIPGYGAAYTGIKTGAPTSTNTGTSPAGEAASAFTGTVTPDAAGALFFAGLIADDTADPALVALTASGWAAQFTETDGDGYWPGSAADMIGQGPSSIFSSSTYIDLSGVLAAVLVTGVAPALPDPMLPNWPLTRFLTAFGAGAQTPWDMLEWTDLSSRFQGLQGNRGKQYELDVIQAGTENYTISNNDGGLTVDNQAGEFWTGLTSWTALNNCSLLLSGLYSYQGQPSMLMIPDGITAYPTAAGTVQAVTPGQQLKAETQVYSPQGWAAGCAVNIDFFADDSYVSSADSTAAGVVPGSWTYLSCVTVVPAGVNQARISLQPQGIPPVTTQFFWAPAPLSTAGIILNTPGWNYQQGPRIYQPERLLVTWPLPPSPSATTYSITRGYMERWPQQLDSSRYQNTQATGTDAWANLTTLMDTLPRSEIKQDLPYVYWPMDDPAGNATASNISGVAGTGSLQVVTSRYGAGGATAAFGTSDDYLAGNAGSTDWEVTGTPAQTTSQGIALYYADQNLPSLAYGATFEGWFLPSATQPAGNQVSLITLVTNRGPAFQVYLNLANGNIEISTWDAVTRAQTITTVSTQDWVTLAQWFHIGVQLGVHGWTAYLNAGDPGNNGTTATAACNLAPTGYWLDYAGNADKIYTADFGNLDVAHLAVFPRLLNQARIVTHYQAALTGIQGTDDAAARLDRLLGDANACYPRLFPNPGDTLTDIVGALDISGNALSQNLTNIVQSDSGLMLVNGAGYIVYLQRIAGWNLPLLWTVGEDTSAGELPYLPSFATDCDPSQVFDDITLIQLATPPTLGATAAGVTIQLTDRAAISQFGDQTLQETVYLTDPDLIGDLANWIDQTSSPPKNRVGGLTLDPSANPALWPVALAAETGQIVLVNRRLAGTQLEISEICQIMTVSHDVKAGKWNTGLTLVPYYGYVLSADDPVYGQANGQNPLGW